MKRFSILIAGLATVVLSARPAHAWDDFGHRVVARIAWANMTPQARARAIAILRAAAPETGLRGSVSGTLSQQRQIELFVFAATWPDVVRDTANPLRMEKYHHPYRHYVDTFWRQDTDFGPVVPVDRQPEGDLLRDAPRLRRWLETGSPEQKALGLAWMLHLVGDIHQPLHASGRISPRDPWGDGGGNTFRVGTRSLHSTWDGVLTDSLNAPRPTAPLTAVTSAATMAMQRHPRSGFSSEIGQRDFAQWAREGVAIAQRDVYRAPLVRDQPVPPAYRTAAFLAAEPRIALAGYRLADLLNDALGD
jgi:S1/P1 Nuclease